MTAEEKNIMADMFYFLRDHDDPPAIGEKTCAAFWEKATKDICSLVGNRWNNHPLAMETGIALCGYLEQKCKAKGNIQHDLPE